MFIGFVNTQQDLGYNCLKDKNCAKRMMLVTDSSVVFVKVITSRGKRKIKKWVIRGMFLFHLAQPLTPCTTAIILPFLPTMELLSPVELDQNLNNKNSNPQISKFFEQKVDKIKLIDKIKLTREQIKELNNILIELKTGSITSDQAVLQIRGGDGMAELIGILVFVILANWYTSHLSTEAFQQNALPHHNPYGWFSGTHNSKSIGPAKSSLKIQRPSSMPHEEFVSLTKEQRRSLSHDNDIKITQPDHPELVVGFSQARFKVYKHGAIHGLPYTVKPDGTTKTERTDDNALKMMKSILDMSERQSTIWFENGLYQGGTNRQFEAIHLYDPNKQIIAVFKKSNGRFVTTCQLNEKEHNELIATSNFGGRDNWYSRQGKNLPPQQIFGQSDEKGLNPISPITEDSSSGFTTKNSFENDVLGITPRDNSQSDI